MDRYSKMQYLKSIYQRYHKSTRKEKREILNEFCTVCGYNRKYAIRILNALPSDEKTKHIKKRDKIYSDTVFGQHFFELFPDDATYSIFDTPFIYTCFLIFEYFFQS